MEDEIYKRIELVVFEDYLGRNLNKYLLKRFYWNLLEIYSEKSIKEGSR